MRPQLLLASVWLGLAAPGWDVSGVDRTWDVTGNTVNEVTAKKHVVIFYTASWCTLCKHEKALIEKELKAGPLPFEVKVVDCTNGGQPQWVKLLPTFHWEHGGQSWQSRSFKRVLQDFRPPKPAKKAVAPQWLWPGMTEESLRQHMMSEPFHVQRHGDVSLLSFETLIMLHDQEHNQEMRK